MSNQVMTKNSKIYVAGHTGMVGSCLLKYLKSNKYHNLLTATRAELDLTNQQAVSDFFKINQPEYVFLIAGKVGGIQANIKYPADFLYQNLMIAANVIESARLVHVKKLLYLGSSCIYPRLAKQPMKEEYLLTGSLEPTNEGYSIGKIAGLKLCEYYKKQYGCNFISVMPPNLYGPGDNFSDDNSHVISALLKKIHYAKIQNKPCVEMWGTGVARREFLFTEDLVEGLEFIMKNYQGDSHINIGSGIDVSIRELGELIRKVVGYSGDFIWDSSKPDGMPKKLMDSAKIRDLGWRPKGNLYDGLTKTYNWYIKNIAKD